LGSSPDIGTGKTIAVSLVQQGCGAMAERPERMLRRDKTGELSSS
jgi:hypothetical protein